MFEDKWCLDCPKCAFVILGVAALDIRFVEKIWGKSFSSIIQSHPNLVGFMRDLANEKKKPFECIGTTEESKWALSMVDDQTKLNVFCKLPSEKMIYLKKKLFFDKGRIIFLPKEFQDLAQKSFFKE